MRQQSHILKAYTFPSLLTVEQKLFVKMEEVVGVEVVIAVGGVDGGGDGDDGDAAVVVIVVSVFPSELWSVAAHDHHHLQSHNQNQVVSCQTSPLNKDQIKIFI